MTYPVYRLFISGVCLALALGMYLVFTRTRLGMMIRAGSTNREMVQSPGHRHQFLYRVVFAAGVAMAVLAGMVAAPVSVGLPGHGQLGADHLLRGGGDRRHRLHPRRAAGRAADRRGRHLRQGAAAAGRRRAGLRADGADPAVEARRACSRPDDDAASPLPRCSCIPPRRPSSLACASPRWRCTRWWPALRRRPGHQDHGLRHLRAQPGTAGGQHRAGVLRPGGVLRHRRLRGGAAVARRRCRLAAVAAAGCVLAAAACTRWPWARCRCAPRACTSSWSRWPSRRWPTTWCTTRRWAAAPTASTSTPSRCWAALDAGQAAAVYGFTWACLLAVFGFLALLLRSRFGRALAGIRVNEQRMRATGFSTYPYKLAAFTMSGGIAGLAGFLFAVKDGFVNPELLSWHRVGRGADHDHPGRPGPPARRADRRLCLRAAAGVLQVRGRLRRLRQALAPGPGPDHHRQRGAAAARAWWACRAVARAPGGQGAGRRPGAGWR
jgi:hypothetical protein